MDQTTTQLRTQLAEHREEVGRDLNAIGDRISPSRMADRGKARMGQRVGRARDRVMGTADSARYAASSTRDSVMGEVRDAPHVTEFAEMHGLLKSAQGDVLQL